MANVAWSVFFPDLLIEVPGVSEPLAEREIREAAIEFCRKSAAWVHRMDPVTILAGEAVYDWDVPAGSLVVRPLEVWLDGEKLTPATSAELSAIYGGDWSAETGTPLYYLSEKTDASSRQVTLTPIPDAGVTPGITARLVLKPARDATEVDEIVYEEFGRDIVLGALARLYLMANKPWSNLKLGEKRERDFMLACSRAGIRAAKMHAGAPLRTAVTHGVK